MPATSSRQALLLYIRAKVDQLLTVMGTLPLRAEELDDETLISLDPIGIVAESFGQVISHLNATNQRLSLATAENRVILDTLGAAVVVLDLDCRVEDCNLLAMDWLFAGKDRATVIGQPADEVCSSPALLDSAFARADGNSHTTHLGGRDLLVMATKIADGGDQSAKIVVLFTDITARVRETEELALVSFALDRIEEAAYLADEQGRLCYVNDKACRALGYSRDELLKMRVIDVDAGTAEPAQWAAAWEHLKTVRSATFESRHRKADGKMFPVEVNGNYFEYLGKPYALGLIRDITQRKRAESELRLAAAAFASHQGIMVTDAETTILRVNQAFTAMTGYAAEEVIGLTPRIFKSGRHDAAFYAAMWGSILNNGSWQGEIWGRRKNGEIYPAWLSISAVTDEHGLTTHYVGTQTDITARKEAEDEIKYLAFYDPLTDLPNRRLLLDRLHHAQANSLRSHSKGALLFIDLDHFKTLNDTLGHDMGDVLLQEVAKRLTTCVREGDTVARLGGDEFVVMLEGLSSVDIEAAEQAEVVGEKILAALATPYRLKGHEHIGSASIGVTLIAGQHGGQDELMKQADLAMYQAKAMGRNALRFFDPNMQAAVTAHVALENDLRQAIREQQFALYYQAQMNREGRITGAEALLRWHHPRRGLVSPGDFIPLAEETGLILPLGNWVLEAGCRQLAAWSGNPDTAPLSLAVNVSVHQLHQTDFVEQVLAVLQRTGADPGKLKLELTESLMMKNVEDSIAKITRLKGAGVRFVLDDFGTGYSSLSHLKRLPLEKLKIDRSFVMDVMSDPNDAAIAVTIIKLADSLGLGVLAEGVETAEQYEFLARNGCHSYQGYWFSRPLPLHEFEVLVRRQGVADSPKSPLSR